MYFFYIYDTLKHRRLQQKHASTTEAMAPAEKIVRSWVRGRFWKFWSVIQHRNTCSSFSILCVNLLLINKEKINGRRYGSLAIPDLYKS